MLLYEVYVKIKALSCLVRFIVWQDRFLVLRLRKQFGNVQPAENNSLLISRLVAQMATDIGDNDLVCGRVVIKVNSRVTAANMGLC